MAGFTVTARVYSDGKREIRVFAGKSAAGRADFYRRRSPFATPRLEDWQVAEADTLTELRSTIIGAFGLGWFNRARKQIASLEAVC